jgi:hypothetical protein
VRPGHLSSSLQLCSAASRDTWLRNAVEGHQRLPVVGNGAGAARPRPKKGIGMQCELEGEKREKREERSRRGQDET